jgi:hypothetical protein
MVLMDTADVGIEESCNRPKKWREDLQVPNAYENAG